MRRQRVRDQVSVLDCLVIGAGQAGLSAGRCLQREGLHFAILERGAAAGAEWARRAPDHKLFTPRYISKLPGLEMTGGPASQCPTNKEMGEYFADYAQLFDLPVRPNCNVIRLTRAHDTFVVDLADGTQIATHSVILANGSNQTPRIPAALADPISHCSTLSTGRNFWHNLPSAGSRVLVVGDGASGRQAALDYAHKGYDTTLCGTHRRLAPATVLGKSLFSWLLAARLLFADRDTLRAKLLSRLNPVPSKKALGGTTLRRAGIRYLPKLVKTLAAVDSDRKICAQAMFADKTVAHFDHITWCIGYTEDSPFNTFAPQSAAHWYTQGRGQTDVPGVFVTGRVWLTSRASELIVGAPHDAQRAVTAVVDYLENRQACDTSVSAHTSNSVNIHA